MQAMRSLTFSWLPSAMLANQTNKQTLFLFLQVQLPHAKRCLFVFILSFIFCCYYWFTITSNHVLNLTSIFSNPVNQKTIYFVETSGQDYFNGRQACAIESAAFHNPHLPVNLLILSQTLNLSNPYVKTILTYPNVRISRLDMNQLFNGSIVGNLYKDGTLAKSKYNAAHTSDMVRLLLLYLNGGIYFDLDVVVLKPVDQLVNFAGKESADKVNGAAMG